MKRIAVIVCFLIFDFQSQIGLAQAPDGAPEFLLETATLGPTGQDFFGIVIDSDQFLGAKFTLDSAAIATSLGAHLTGSSSNPEIFFAIVPLDAGTDFPVDFELTEAVFTTTFDAPLSSAEVEIESNVILQPGRFGLMTGSGLFGATGNAAMPAVDFDIGMPEYFFSINFVPQYQNGGFNNARFFVRGATDVTTFGGLAHFPLGQAEIAEDPDGSIVVSNIGSSGDDGVAVGLGEARGWGFSFEDLDLDSPIGAFKQWEMKGMVDGVPNQTIWIERHEVASVGDTNVVQVSFDTSTIGATSNVIEVYDGDSLVFSDVLPNGPMYNYFTTEPDPPPLDLTVQWDATCVVLPDPLGWPIETTGENGTVITTYDRIVTYPLDPTREVTFCSQVDSTAALIPETRLRDEVLVVFDALLPHRSLGQATFQAADETLTVSNIGSSGKDGVSIGLSNTHRFDVEWMPIGSEATTPTGASLRIQATGSLDGQPGQGLGFVVNQDTGSAISIDADFSDFGSPTQLIQVFDNGILVGEVSGHTGPVATVPDWPIGVGKLGQENGGAGTKCYTETWEETIPIAIVGGPTLMGDELRILAEGSFDIGELDGFSVLLADTPDLTLTGEATDVTTTIFIDGFESGDTSRWSNTIP